MERAREKESRCEGFQQERVKEKRVVIKQYTETKGRPIPHFSHPPLGFHPQILPSSSSASSTITPYPTTPQNPS